MWQKLAKMDRILLFYPIILYVLIIGFAGISPYLMGSYWGRDQIFISGIFTFILLGNFAHNFISFWQLARIDEFKQWSRQYRFYRLSIWQIATLTYIAFIALVFLLLPKGYDTFEFKDSNSNWIRFIIFLLYALNTYHNLAQLMGIGISFTHRYGAQVSKNDIDALTRKEKVLYRLFFLDACIFMALFIFKNQLSQLTQAYQIIRLIALVVMSLWIIREYLKLPKELARIKLVYNLRHAYRFFFAVHPIIQFLSFGVHGADAMITYWKAVRKSQSIRKHLLSYEILIIFILLGIFYVLFYLMKLFSPMMQGFLVSIFLTHYVVEGFMYRMRDDITRKYISPLL